MSYLDAFFQLLVDVRTAGVAVAKSKVLNFSSDFSAVFNPATGGIDISFGGAPGITEITDTQHGARGALLPSDAPLHPTAIAGGAPGFLSGAWAALLSAATSSSIASTLVQRGSQKEAGFGFLTIGIQPATSGAIRADNALALVVARNATNAANITCVATDASNDVFLGPPTGEGRDAYLRGANVALTSTDITVTVGDIFRVRIGANTLLEIDGTRMAVFGHALAGQAADFGALTDNTGATPDNTIEAMSDPANTPISADDLRDDLVANYLAATRRNVADLTEQVNAVRTVLRAHGWMA